MQTHSDVLLFFFFTVFFLTCQQTGPKGVIKDYQRFKQLERERREEQKEELQVLAKKFSLTCRTNVTFSHNNFVCRNLIKSEIFFSQAEDDKAKSEEDKLEEELAKLMDESCIQQFVQQRMQVYTFPDLQSTNKTIC